MRGIASAPRLIAIFRSISIPSADTWCAGSANAHTSGQLVIWRMGRDLSGSELPIDEWPEWGRPTPLRIAREKCDVLSTAVCAIETGRDGDGQILHSLTNDMAGRYGVEMLRGKLERTGMAPGQSNVVDLSAHRAAGIARHNHSRPGAAGTVLRRTGQAEGRPCSPEHDRWQRRAPVHQVNVSLARSHIDPAGQLAGFVVRSS